MEQTDLTRSLQQSLDRTFRCSRRDDLRICLYHCTRLSADEMGTQNDSHGITGSDRRVMRRNQETDNPCYKEHLLSLRCLDSNQTDRNECKLYFQNYNNCKKFWASVQADRRSKGIKPHMPPLEERINIKMKLF